MAIKVIIMDIDGTLVNDEKVITPLTKETLLKAQDKGVRLVLASGRPTSGLLKLAEELDMENHHGLFVCFNGSKVVDCQSHETLYNHAISVEDSKAVLEHLKQDQCLIKMNICMLMMFLIIQLHIKENHLM